MPAAVGQTAGLYTRGLFLGTLVKASPAARRLTQNPVLRKMELTSESDKLFYALTDENANYIQCKWVSSLSIFGH
jgi:hypothetical protein